MNLFTMWKRRGHRGRALTVRPWLEALEDRTVLDAAIADPTHILVRFQLGASRALPGGMSLGDSYSSLVSNLYEVRLANGLSVDQALTALRNNPNVAYAQPDYLVQIAGVPNDPSFSNLWGLHNTGQSGGTVDADIDGPEAWDVSTGSGSTVVAVIDTGVDYNHEDLAANIWTNSGETPGDGIDNDGNGYIDDVRGWDWVSNDANPMDDNSHGTHVAGTIGAVGNNGVGVAGVAWNVKIMALKFLGAFGSGSTSNAIKALNYAVANGASISNNSWGGGGYSQALADAINAARGAGHIFVAAAGNSGADVDVTPFYPASYNVDNVVAVAATDRYDRLASFSNYGDSTVDLAAPGVSIYSTLPGGSYGYKSGTSMAAPHVAGALALVRGQHPAWSHAAVIEQVVSTVDSLTTLQGKTISGGRLNVARAVSYSGPSLPTLVINDVSVTEGNSGPRNATFTITLSAASGATVTVNYATANGTAGAGVDYQADTGVVTFSPGETRKTVTIQVNGDTVVEPDETFVVNLTNAVNATISDSQGTATIVNDDTAPVTVSIGNATAVEGNAGAKTITFTVTLSAISTAAVTVDYATGSSSGNAATAGSDYEAASGTVSFAAGATALTQTVSVTILSDTNIEPHETFLVSLTNATNATISGGDGVGTIRNDDTAIAINDVTQALAGNGTTNFVFTVSLVEASALAVSVKFATANGTLTSPNGYNATSGTLTFAPGETTKTISVKVKRGNVGDFFRVNLTNAANAIFADASGVGTIAAAGTSMSTSNWAALLAALFEVRPGNQR